MKKQAFPCGAPQCDTNGKAYFLSLSLSLHQRDEGFHLGGEPFILVVKQLPPHLHAAGGDIQAGQRSGGEGILYDVLRQEGEPHAVLDHLAEQGSTAQLEKGLDGQPLRRHALVEASR